MSRYTVTRQAAPRLWVIVGATGTGKTGLSIELAEHLSASGCPAEIVNADAMQLYRGMDIGTAKISPDDRRGITHHLFDVLDVTQDATVAWYQPAARATIAEINRRGADAILVGGSGLYVSSVIYDFRFPPHDAAVRARLERELELHGPGVLFARLQAADSRAAARIDPRNGRRVVRALEIVEQGEATHGSTLPARPQMWHPSTILAGMTMPREHLTARLDERVVRMWEGGLLDEVARLRALGIERGVTAQRAIGYAQALAQINRQITQDEAIAQTQQLTRRYARRQVSWFRRYESLTWFDAPMTPRSVLDLAGMTAT